MQCYLAALVSKRFYSLGCFLSLKSIFNRFTTFSAALLSSPGVESLGGSKIDHSTLRLLRSTMKRLPFPRPPAFTRNSPAPRSRLFFLSLPVAFFVSSAGGGGGSGGAGGGYNSFNFVSKDSPTRSVRIASALFGSVTT